MSVTTFETVLISARGGATLTFLFGQIAARTALRGQRQDWNRDRFANLCSNLSAVLIDIRQYATASRAGPTATQAALDDWTLTDAEWQRLRTDTEVFAPAIVRKRVTALNLGVRRLENELRIMSDVLDLKRDHASTPQDDAAFNEAVEERRKVSFQLVAEVDGVLDAIRQVGKFRDG